MEKHLLWNLPVIFRHQPLAKMGWLAAGEGRFAMTAPLLT
jgi:hypothetical protein